MADRDSRDFVRSASGPVHEDVHREKQVPDPEYSHHSKNYAPWRLGSLAVSVLAMAIIFWVVLFAWNTPGPVMLPETAISQPETHLGDPHSVDVKVNQDPQIEFEGARAGATSQDPEQPEAAGTP